jgi:hypothetical protein
LRFPGRYLLADSLLLLSQLGSEIGSEVLRFEHLTELHLSLPERRPLQPFDGVFLRFHLPEPEPRYQLFRLGEGPVYDGSLVARESHPRALGARLETLAGQHYTSLGQLLIELSHLGEQLPAG